MPRIPSTPLLVADYTYVLPNDRIAVRPVAERSASRLLVAKSHSDIEHRSFSDLPSLLPEHSLLVVNTSKVFRARIPMLKATGGAAEVLLIAPKDPLTDPLSSTDASEWECLIGGRHVLPSSTLTSPDGVLSCLVLERNGTEGVVRLEWTSNETLGEILERIGQIPLPPYLGREAEADDSNRYQTVYADKQGSAAAPTAGLHFTNDVFAALDTRDIEHIDLLLHVGLGTFKPIDVEDVRDHVMHTERISVHRKAIEQYVQHALSPEPFVTVVGTTSLRALESVYWFGARGLEGGFHIEQWAAFEEGPHPTRAQAFAAVLQWMNDNKLDVLEGSTSILLAPGCHIATADALVTNFHQPGNTLLLLVAAFCGGDDWKKVYDTALAEGYRFLSYGDSSVIVRTNDGGR